MVSRITFAIAINITRPIVYAYANDKRKLKIEYAVEKEHRWLVLSIFIREFRWIDLIKSGTNFISLVRH